MSDGSMDQDNGNPEENHQNVQIKQRSPFWRKILMALGGIFLLLIIIFGYIFYSGMKEISEVEPVVVEFFELLSVEDIDTAYELTNERFKEEVTRSELGEYANIFNEHVDGISTVEMEGFTRGAYTYQGKVYEYRGVITDSGGEKANMRVSLTETDGRWEILNVNFDFK